MAGMRYQPGGRVRLDWSNPLTRELVFAWTASGPDVNLVTGRPGTWRGTPAELAAYPNGLKRKFIGGGSLDFGYDANVAFHGQMQQTVFADVFVPDTATATGYICGRVRGAWDYHLGVEFNVQQFRYAAGAQSGGLGAPPSPVQGALKPYEGRPVAVCGTYDRAVGQRIYLDGLLINSNSQTTAFNPASQDAFAIGARGGGGQSALNGAAIGLVLLFRRALSAEEALNLSANPWQLFLSDDDFDYPILEAIKRVLTVGAATLAMASGQVRMSVSRRLTALPAGLTLAGGVVEMRAARRVTVSPAALVVAGGDVSARASRRLSVDRAALEIDGGQVAMRAARRLGVQPSVFELAGGDVGMRAGRRLGVAPAGLALAAGDVSLRAARRLSMAPAVLVLTGGQVDMLYAAKETPGSYTLPVSAAAMALGGGEVRMRVSRRLVVAPAQLDLAAGAVRALVGRRLLVSSAAVAVGAGSVGIVAHRRLPVAATALALAPGDVTLRYSSQIEYARAPLGAGYAPQRVTVSVRPAQTGGFRPPATQETIR